MLASPLMPTSGFSSEDTMQQYRPAKDMESFKSLLPPPIEFVEGSSSGALATDENKYQPINTTPRPTRVEVSPFSITQETKKSASNATIPQSPNPQRAASIPGKQLFTSQLSTAWPTGATVGSGFHNSGNTCFLNSALQCLLHTPPLLHVLIAHSKSDPCAFCRSAKNAFCMACSLRQVMHESHTKRRAFAPYPITTKLQVIAKHMRRGRQEDSHEFLRYAIDALQKSCLAGYPQKVDPKLAETTWVHKIFGGRLRSRVTCLECDYNSDTFDNVLDLSVDIYGAQSLKEALRKFVAVDHLKGADKYKCEKCKKPVTADKQFTVHDAPLVLTLHLKRFSPMGRKISHPVKYEEHLSLQPYMSQGQHGPTYSLYGVISHAGGGPNSGHYYAHVKGCDNQWYEMNDDSVTRHPGTPTSMRSAYILFYMRDKGHALEAAVKAPVSPALPTKTGLVAGMKKRKVSGSDEEVSSKRAKSATDAPFIGPLLPSPMPATDAPKDASTSHKASADPQAKTLAKKIAAVSKSPTSALASLSQYHDDSDDDIGEKIEVPKTKVESGDDFDSDDKPPAPSLTLTSATPKPAPPGESLSSKGPLYSSVPTTSFYGSKSNARDDAKSKKRKSPEPGEDDEESLRKWARTPLSPSATSTPAKGRKSSGSKFAGGSNPISSRLTGSNNLRRDPGQPVNLYGKKKRHFLM
ncbi:hypothetical protein POSPLADRAFT_1172765 [Postia placenta MAD-698-R-SB12]|uniref:Ubiquitin carboxyl-terminal hydrolase n=1 Tax=Postia placenta MAD-698-R-SB12 TaxID=670580 RepID=A0A1X6MTA5_9APHY|nr:hypothetical protein POSPLADRAFT_1172765 [Postia placenta MAD-698-R-SB12]OSX59456.1 hypothetical protein POSPLADRAFT_1172765 [Postia placenta MAD-698-R-SB12]